jgi:hypothetical protein
MAAVLAASALPAMAQDAVKVDPKHYKVELEKLRCVCFASPTANMGDAPFELILVEMKGKS